MEEYVDEVEEVSYDEDIGESYSLEWALKDEGKREGKIEIAKSLLKNNVDINIIIASTGLTKEEIEMLK